MVLVDPEHRRKGIGTMLLRQAIASLSACACIKLDATPEGKKVYEPLGFTGAGTLERMIRLPSPAPSPDHPIVRLMRTEDLGAVTSLDAEAFGVERATVLEGLLRMAPQYACVFEQDGRIEGFALGRPGENFDSVGPLVARSAEIAVALGEWALSAAGARPMGMDVPPHAAWMDWLVGHGFRRERSFVRMVRGADAAPGNATLSYAICGPELG